MEPNPQVISLKLEIEDLEERIAPTLTLTTPGGHVVQGPDAATGGAVTAFTNVTAHTNAPAAHGLSLSFNC